MSGWTILPEPTPSVAPSEEDESIHSSQEMQDQIIPSPRPTPGPRVDLKRKVPTSGKGQAPSSPLKRSRLAVPEPDVVIGSDDEVRPTFSRPGTAIPFLDLSQKARGQNVSTARPTESSNVSQFRNKPSFAKHPPALSATQPPLKSPMSREIIELDPQTEADRSLSGNLASSSSRKRPVLPPASQRGWSNRTPDRSPEPLRSQVAGKMPAVRPKQHERPKAVLRPPASQPTTLAKHKGKERRIRRSDSPASRASSSDELPPVRAILAEDRARRTSGSSAIPPSNTANKTVRKKIAKKKAGWIGVGPQLKDRLVPPKKPPSISQANTSQADTIIISDSDDEVPPPVTQAFQRGLRRKSMPDHVNSIDLRSENEESLAPPLRTRPRPSAPARLNYRYDGDGAIVISSDEEEEVTIRQQAASVVTDDTPMTVDIDPVDMQLPLQAAESADRSARESSLQSMNSRAGEQTSQDDETASSHPSPPKSSNTSSPSPIVILPFEQGEQVAEPSRANNETGPSASFDISRDLARSLDEPPDLGETVVPSTRASATGVKTDQLQLARPCKGTLYSSSTGFFKSIHNRKLIPVSRLATERPKPSEVPSSAVSAGDSARLPVEPAAATAVIASSGASIRCSVEPAETRPAATAEVDDAMVVEPPEVEIGHSTAQPPVTAQMDQTKALQPPEVQTESERADGVSPQASIASPRPPLVQTEKLVAQLRPEDLEEGEIFEQRDPKSRSARRKLRKQAVIAYHAKQAANKQAEIDAAVMRALKGIIGSEDSQPKPAEPDAAVMDALKHIIGGEDSQAEPGASVMDTLKRITGGEDSQPAAGPSAPQMTLTKSAPELPRRVVSPRSPIPAPPQLQRSLPLPRRATQNASIEHTQQPSDFASLSLEQVINNALQANSQPLTIDLTGDSDDDRVSINSGDEAAALPSAKIFGTLLPGLLEDSRATKAMKTEPAIPAPNEHHSIQPPECAVPSSTQNKPSTLDEIRQFRKQLSNSASWESIPDSTAMQSPAPSAQAPTDNGARQSGPPGDQLDSLPQAPFVSSESVVGEVPEAESSGILADEADYPDEIDMLSGIHPRGTRASNASDSEGETVNIPYRRKSRKRPAEPAEIDDQDEEEECAGLLLTYPETSEGSDARATRSTSRKRLRRHSGRLELPRRSGRSSSATSESSLVDLVGPSFDSARIHLPRRGESDDLVPAMADIHINGMKRGFLTWAKDGVRWAREFADVHMLAENLPHELQDRMNALSPAARRADNMQVKVFEGCISANTAGDEPYAPDIHVINEIDDELTPPFEFHYTNLMWHSAQVPKPDYDNLKGCGCRGTCDNNSKTCSCLLRQRKYWKESGKESGFIYDARGRLRAHEYPIFECNMFCGCGDECRNRVVQHGRKVAVNIQKTLQKGWGVFAGPKRIPAHTFLGIYSGEYLTDAEGDERGSKYNKFGRTYLFNLDFFHLKQGNPNWQTKYCVDAYHAGNFTRYLNHSCDPNCQINACYINEANLEKPLLTIFTLRDVEPGEELCFSYFGSASDDDAGPDGKSVNGLTDSPNSDAIYVACQCGAAKCTGRIWL